MNVLEAFAVERTETHVRVEVRSWATAVRAARADGYDYFCFLSGIDWLPNPALDGEHHFDTSRDAPGEQEIITDPAIRQGGGTSRFSVFANLQNLETRSTLMLIADVEQNVPTITHVFPGADWHERETWEMYGFVFDGHPDLKHLYLPEEFEGFPLRKDFALPARLVRPWPGLVDMEEMPAVEEQATE